MKSAPNVSELLDLIWRSKAHTRAEASRILKWSRPTVSSLTEQLIGHGLLCESGHGVSSGGKPPVLLEMNPHAFSAIGIDAGYRGQLLGVLVNAKSEIIDQCTVPCGERYDEILNAAAELVKQLKKENTIGVGIAVSALVNPISGCIIESARFDLNDKSLQSDLERFTGLNVVVDNRSRSSARSEHFGGAADKEENFALVSLGKSIGTALFLGNRFYYGARGASGEIRTMMIRDEKGNAQTLEAAMDQLSAQTQNLTESQLAERCANGLLQFLALLDVDCMVLSGRFAELGEEFHSLLRARITEHYRCRVILSKFGKLSAARGAAVAVGERYIKQ